LDPLDPTTDLFAGGDKPGSPEKLSRLRLALNQKAKQEPKFRFYALYDRIYRLDTLTTAWILVCRKGGAAGSDGVTFAQVQESSGGVAGFLGDLQEDLRNHRYTPAPVRRVYIPKADGTQRPLSSRRFATGSARWRPC
jgi:RNA-directed DNA polymerase